jgi:hypothetical protein
VVPGGSGGGIPGNGGWAGLAFWRFFSGRCLAIQPRVEPEDAFSSAAISDVHIYRLCRCHRSQVIDHFACNINRGLRFGRGGESSLVSNFVPLFHMVFETVRGTKPPPKVAALLG